MKVKRFIAVLICILMMAGLIPASVLADGAAGETGPGSEGGSPGIGTVLTDGGTITSGTYYLAGDVTLTQMIYIPKSGIVTIDLNGHVEVW